VQTYGAVSGESPVVPIPTLAFSIQPHPKWVLAFGTWAPYAAIASYPEERTAPQRYSLFSLDGSVLAFVGAGAAFAPSKEWRIGAAIGVLAGSFNTRVAFSGCVPERFFCAPEDPDWDVASELSVGPIVAPTGEAGAIWIPDPKWRIGLSFQAPVYVRARATVRTRLPSTPIFAQAYQDGEEADVAFNLPWNLRVGVETRIIDDLRLELGGGFERWSMHDNISIDPDGVALKDVAAFPETYYLPTIDFPRNFQDSASVRLGGEYSFELLEHRWEGRAGVSFETSAVPSEYLSVLTIDSSKVTTALGLGLHVGKFRFDAVFAHVFASSVDVDPKAARIPQISPVDANAPKDPNYINGGSYSAAADVIGLGVAYTFEPAPVEAE
jgi:long-chain fatty acid transport protein